MAEEVESAPTQEASTGRDSAALAEGANADRDLTALAAGQGQGFLHKATALLGQVGQAVASLQATGGSNEPERCVFCGRLVRRGEQEPDVGAQGSELAKDPGECRSCLTEAERDALVEAQKRLHTVLATFLKTGQTEGHIEPEETNTEMAVRLGTATLSSVGQLLWLVPGVGGAAQTLSVAEGLLRYGPFALYYQEMHEALSLLVLLSREVNAETPSVHAMDVAELAIGIYYLFVERGNARGLDPLLPHREHLGCTPLQAGELGELAALLPLASPIAYSSSAAEAQRHLALLPGDWRLVLKEEAGAGGQPACILAVQKGRAAVLVPGTQSPGDLVTDLQVRPARVQLGPGPKDVGWAHRGMLRAAFALVRLLGTLVEVLEGKGYEVVFVGHSLGGAVAALAALLLRQGEEGMARSARVRAVCYAMPACGDARLCRFCEGFVTSVINCDDIVPRLRFETIQFLCAELESRREEFWRYAQQDFEALKDVKSLVELKRRGGAEPKAALAAEVALAPPPAPLETSALALDPAPTTSALQRLLDFFSCHLPRHAVEAEVLVEEPLSSVASADDEDDDEGPTSFSKVKLHPPGRLVHLYRHCGTRRAAWVRRSHPALQRIEVDLGLFQDHSGEAYRDALEGVSASLQGARPPPWKPFAEVGRCACCHEAFGWDSVLRSEPHRLHARHHCHACGDVICTSCSQRRRYLPQLGATGEARVCDRCFLKPAGSVVARPGAVKGEGKMEGGSAPMCGLFAN